MVTIKQIYDNVKNLLRTDRYNYMNGKVKAIKK